MNRPNFYAVIPASVRYDEDLPPNAKLLYGEISALCNQNGHCWAGNEYFADLYGKSKETISRWISSLKRNGHIGVEVDQKQGNNRVIYLLTKTSNPIDKNVKPLLTKTSNPIDKNVKYNITKNITIEESVTRAYNFLQNEVPIRLEQEFLIQYKSQIKNFKKFLEDFNDKVEEEQLPFEYGVLLSRLRRFARNWIDVDNRKSVSDPDVEPTIMKMIR